MKLSLLIAGAIVLTATPAFAAPQWVETVCWRYANRILPAPTAREREGYFANCIADWTAGTPPPQAAIVTAATDIDWQSPQSLILARHRETSQRADAMPRGVKTST
jgi:hypothetical protein